MVPTSPRHTDGHHCRLDEAFPTLRHWSAKAKRVVRLGPLLLTDLEPESPLLVEGLPAPIGMGWSGCRGT